MPTECAGLLKVVPQQSLGEPKDGNVQVTVRSSRGLDGGNVTTQRSPIKKTWVALDIFCFLVASIPFLVCEINIIPPVRRGFFCNDSSISYPLQHVETISDLVLITVGVLIAALMIILGESFRVHNLPQGSRSTVPNPYVVALYKEVGAFLFGCTVGQSLTNVAKTAVGRLRPYFLAACQPNLTHFNCKDGYLEDYVCTGGASLEREARKSFYSGHASFAMYTMMYLVVSPCAGAYESSVGSCRPCFWPPCESQGLRHVCTAAQRSSLMLSGSTCRPGSPGRVLEHYVRWSSLCC
ncbi:phospholipid phosphatase 3-like isoform X2 [Varanus komodoensis]|uniref:phospholipid phosphatase 3-like isoform X2 n=1 Tax=Varanus komodoensis TaxID=61221 RepID=UPI001CF7B439|nr:phospholipid phosphatase 3-like isoform X2 [Varanus komodoensis]